MEPEDLLRLVVTVCKAQGLRYLVTGSTATIAYGEPRFTNDIDIVLELHREQFAAPEDVILMKLKYNKEGGSQKASSRHLRRSDGSRRQDRSAVHCRMGEASWSGTGMDHGAKRHVEQSPASP